MIEPSAWIVDYETVTGVSYGQEVKSYWTTKRLRTFDKHQVEYLLGQEALGGDTLHAVRNVEVISLYTEVDANKKVCGTCRHYGKREGSSIAVYDSDCFECSQYYANKWEAK